MKNSILTLSMLLGICISANARSGIYLNPLISQAAKEQFSSTGYCGNFPGYSCKVRVRLIAEWHVGVSAECEGGGTSETSAAKACDYAYEALASCMQHAADFGFRRDTPRPVAPLNRYGEW